jgi:hypothetical protein
MGTVRTSAWERLQGRGHMMHRRVPPPTARETRVPGYVCRLAAAALVVAFVIPAQAQISPGELSKAHASLEGIANCTQCHTLGHTLANDRCLACHDEIGARIRAGRGPHARSAGSACVECHKEHHGRSFKIVQLDRDRFDHAGEAGFPLNGKHRSLKCESCHTASLVRVPEMAGKSNRNHTFLGLSTACADCHADPHSEGLGTRCAECHTESGWRPAPGFSHARTNFPLAGKHEAARCVSCHPASPDASLPVRFAGARYASCADCHSNPHRKKFGQECSSCHTPAGWGIARRSFDHATTRFQLAGKHAQVRCESCHRKSAPAAGEPEFRIPAYRRCADCHSDPHRGQFARRADRGACESCHSVDGWTSGRLVSFNHSTTRFPLRGKHGGITCGQCHRGAGAASGAVEAARVSESKAAGHASAPPACANCHADRHGGQFTSSGRVEDCATCHTEAGFMPPAYTREKHALTRFPLVGAHEAVACNECHRLDRTSTGSVRVFRRASAATCTTCHTDPHRQSLAAWTARGCEGCHSSSAWGAVSFAHDQTRFPLDGKHRRLRCAACHAPGPGTAAPSWTFKGVHLTCEGCHPPSGRDKRPTPLTEGNRS